MTELGKHPKESVEFTNMCMISDQNGHVLMQKRVGDHNWPGLAFPGGHVEMGESFTDSVVREVQEETGLTIEHPCLCGIKDWVKQDGSRYVVLCYKAAQWTGTVTSSDEGEVTWVNVNDLPKLKLSQGMRSTLRLFFEETTSEQWFECSGDEWIEVIK